MLKNLHRIIECRLRLKPEGVDIVELVNYTLDRFEPSISLRNKTLSRQLPKESVMTMTDKEAVTKIISNLLNNALKYADSKISVVLESGEGLIRIKVVSDGEKISEEDKDRIFETFYQTDKSQEQKNGVGIGLPLSRSLAGLLGGDLYLEANASDNNTFVLTLPMKSTSQTGIPPASDNH